MSRESNEINEANETGPSISVLSSSRYRLSRFKIEAPEKSIDFMNSFALLVNNISGPAMMGLPHLFIQAGVIPTLVTIILVCITSSLCGTLLADSIAFIPGNRQFQRCIDFPSAFYVIAGDMWYTVAEVLFLISCMVQACAALVETAQSLDGFIASFVLDRTYALELFPRSFSIIEWSSAGCIESQSIELNTFIPMEEADIECETPFKKAGTLILSLGFVITTVLFVPLGVGNLKETMFVQLLSFGFLLLLLSQFYGVFLSKGFDNVANLTFFGDDWTQLTGVVLFNFAFSITVPSWLCEKRDSVSVNKVIWFSTIFSATIYISFGILAAISFDDIDISSNVLVVLSSKEVNLFTRICAALFGVSIIGCSVPVYCIIIKNTLYSSGLFSAPMSFFIGALFPYIISWMLYQGEALMNMLNWTGLIVNGMVAFVLPLLLASFTFKRRDRYKYEYMKLSSLSTQTVHLNTKIVSVGNYNQSDGLVVSSNNTEIDSNHTTSIELVNLNSEKTNHNHSHSHSRSHSHREHSISSKHSKPDVEHSDNHNHGYGSDSSNDSTDEEDDTLLSQTELSDHLTKNSNTMFDKDSLALDSLLNEDEDEIYEKRIQSQHRPIDSPRHTMVINRNVEILDNMDNINQFHNIDMNIDHNITQNGKKRREDENENENEEDDDDENTEEIPLILEVEDRDLTPLEAKKLKRLRTLERRLRSVISPLPSFLQPYLGIIVYSLIIGFSTAIVSTIIVDLFYGADAR